MNIVQLAGSLARRADFQAFVACAAYGKKSRHAPSSKDRLVGAELAAQFIRDKCGVQSRKELATDAAAEQRFHQHVRRPYVAWREQQEMHA